MTINFKNFIFGAIVLMTVLLLPIHALAVPDTVSVRITDVTTSSFSVVWMTDVAADPSVEVYADSAMTTQITDKLMTIPMPAGTQEIIQAAKNKGIMKVRISGLSPATKYYVRTVTKDPSNLQSIGYSAVYEVLTASKVMPYQYTDGKPEGFA